MIPKQITLSCILLLFSSLACNLPRTTMPTQSVGRPIQFIIIATGTATPFRPATRDANDPILTPTPDALRMLPTTRAFALNHTVRINETMGDIADIYGVTIEEMIIANNLPNPDVLSIGQVLVVPAPLIAAVGPAFKIIPDSELVNGPANSSFYIDGFVNGHAGYLSTYVEEVDGIGMSGWQIVDRVAAFYSVNPRLLLALLEYQSGWLTNPSPQESTLLFPMGWVDSYREGLYRQMSWAANNLNKGYYLWKTNAIGVWGTSDNVYIPIDGSINAGSAGVQHYFSLLYDEPGWRHVVSEGGFYQTFNQLFGYPFDWAIEPLVPSGLIQPNFQLPFESGVAWVLTGGPHNGWDLGSAWAAMDFAPSSEQLGCAQKDEWVVAVADGLIVRSENGGVFQDLDGDGVEQTGWTVFYMHVESRERVQVGQMVKAGDRIGHPSCEGGFSSGSHLHIARRYNGEWISAGGVTPFVMDGWTTLDDGVFYGGALVRGDVRVEPCQCRDPGNMVQR